MPRTRPVVAPANLPPRWQRELNDRFREAFEVIRGENLRTSYGRSSRQDRDRVITSIAWVSRVEDARERRLRSHWDLIVGDDAQTMSAYADDRKTLADRLGESLSSMTDHYLFMTATPHKGDAETFGRFLALHGRDVYGSVKSLEDAMRRGRALRSTCGGPGEALVSFPDPDTGEVKTLFTQRGQDDHLRAERRGVRLPRRPDARRRGPVDPRLGRRLGGGAAAGFNRAVLKRRRASSIDAVRRSLERMKAKREDILADPGAHRRPAADRPCTVSTGRGRW